MSDDTKERTYSERLESKDGVSAFGIHWKGHDHYFGFEVWKLTLKLEVGVRKWFQPDEMYCHGSIRWDGCSNLNLNPSTIQHHFCGFKDYMDHMGLLQHLYVQAFEHMGREPDDCDSEGQAFYRSEISARGQA